MHEALSQILLARTAVYHYRQQLLQQIHTCGTTACAVFPSHSSATPVHQVMRCSGALQVSSVNTDNYLRVEASAHSQWFTWQLTLQ